ncbi:MAG: hypothetical protein ACLRZQ_00495 [Akkermansia muciniphila]
MMDAAFSSIEGLTGNKLWSEAGKNSTGYGLSLQIFSTEPQNLLINQELMKKIYSE